MNAPSRPTPPSGPHAPITSADFRAIAARGGFGDLRVELLRGVIVKMSPKHLPHGRTQTEIADALRAATATAGLSWKVYQEISVAFADGFEPMPDIVVWDPALAEGPLDGPIPGGAVKLVVEVAASSLSADLGPMLEDYARAGVPEYWVADVKGRVVLQHADPEDGAYARRSAATFGTRAALLTAPHLVADLAALA